MESSIEASGTSASSAGVTPVTEEPKATKEEDGIQLEPTKSEMERERLLSRAEQVNSHVTQSVEYGKVKFHIYCAVFAQGGLINNYILSLYIILLNSWYCYLY